MPDDHFRIGAAQMSLALQGNTGTIPIYSQLHEFAAFHKGIASDIFYNDARELVSAQLEVANEFGFQVPTVTFDVYNIEAEGLGQKLVFDREHMPDIDRTQPLLRQEADLEKIKTPDFERRGRFKLVVEILKLFKEMSGVDSSLRFCAPFTLAANLRGIERLLMDIYLQPAFAHELLTRLTEDVLAPYLLYQKSCLPGSTTASGADAIASLPIVDMNILENWCLPSIQRLQELTGLPTTVVNWVGERYLKSPERLLDLKLPICGGVIQAQDPDVASLGPLLFKQYALEKDVALILGIGATFLAQGSPEQIRERVRQYAQVGGRKGRFGLYLCSISQATPPQNVRAAIQTVHELNDSGLMNPVWDENQAD